MVYMMILASHPFSKTQASWQVSCKVLPKCLKNLTGKKYCCDMQLKLAHSILTARSQLSSQDAYNDMLV